MNDKELQEAFIQFLAQKSGAKTQKDLEKYIQSLGEDGLKKAYSEFAEIIQSQTKKAAHGAKLNYIKQLKHTCNDDEELVFFKRGGSIGCGCKKKKVSKKSDGGNMEDPIKRFRKRPIAEEDTIHTKKGIRDLSGKHPQYPRFNFKEATKEEHDRASEKDYNAGRADHNMNPNIKSNFNKNYGKNEKNYSNRLKKFQEGGKTRYNEFSMWDLVPLVGTYRDIVRAYDNPTAGNITTAVISGLADAASLGTAGTAIKVGAKANKIRKALKANKYLPVDTEKLVYTRIVPNGRTITRAGLEVPDYSFSVRTLPRVVNDATPAVMTNTANIFGKPLTHSFFTDYANKNTTRKASK